MQNKDPSILISDGSNGSLSFIKESLKIWVSLKDWDIDSCTLCLNIKILLIFLSYVHI